MKTFGVTVMRFTVTVPLLALAACSGAPGSQENASSESAALSESRRQGAVFTMSNDAAGNEVLAFTRDPDGALSGPGIFSTGGLGSGGGLGSQGALALTEDGRYLLVVNAGSNDVSSFAVDGASLSLLSTVSSGGVRPVSVAVHEGLVYVVNAGGVNDVAGLQLDHDGVLAPVPDSARSLSADAPGPAQVSFAPRGDAVVVTEKGTNLIDVFGVGDDGTLGELRSIVSAGQTPFGFAFTRKGVLVVSEAFGGAAGQGALSSYDVDDEGERVTPVSASIPDQQSAPCWVVLNRDEHYAYTSNTASGVLSGYSVSRDGSLELLTTDGVSGSTGTGSKPIDMAFDRSARHLYVLNTGTRDIESFGAASDGSLTKTSVAVIVPASAVGLAAR